MWFPRQPWCKLWFIECEVLGVRLVVISDNDILDVTDEVFCELFTACIVRQIFDQSRNGPNEKRFILVDNLREFKFAIMSKYTLESLLRTFF